MFTTPEGELVPEWTKETFTRQRLLAFSNNCQRLAATVQSQIMTWAEYLDPEE